MKNKQRIMNKELIVHKEEFASNIKVLSQYLVDIIKVKDFEALKILAKISPITKLTTPTRLSIILTPLVHYDKYLNITEYLIKESGLDLTSYKCAKNGSDILSEAAIYGATRTVKFLLNRGFDPTLKDVQGQNALHKAAHTNNAEIVELLARKVNINIQDNQGLTALHIASALKNNEVKQKLLKLKAKRDIKDLSGKTYIQSASLINGEHFTFSLAEENLDNITYYLGKINLLKGMFSHKDNCKYLSNSINNFKKTIKMLFPKSENLGEDTLVCFNSLKFLIDINGFYKDDQATYELDDFIVSAAIKFNNIHILCAFYNNLCIEYIRLGDFKEALKHAELAYEYYQKDPDSLSIDLKWHILFCLGLSNKMLAPMKALEYFAEAEKITPFHVRIVEEKMFIYLANYNLEKLLEQTSQIRDADYRNLWTIFVHLKLGNNCPEILEKFKFSTFKPEDLENNELAKYILYQDVCVELSILNKDYSNAITICKDLINKSCINTLQRLVKILEIFKIAGQWEEGYKFLEESYNKFDEILTHQQNLAFTYYEFLFQEKNNFYEKASVALKKLIDNYHSCGTIHNLVYFAIQIRICTDINNKNLELASSNISDIKGKFNDDFDVKKEEYLIKTLKKTDGAIIAVNEVNETQKNIESVVALINWTEEEFEESLSTLTAQQIHAYFQYKKQLLLAQKINALTDREEALSLNAKTSWLTAIGEYKLEQENIYLIEQKNNFYATISPKILDKFDCTVINQLNQALSKGMASKNFLSSGIKFFDNIYELKINAALRLYTSTIYKNEADKYLIVFDQYDKTHSKISKNVNSQLEVVMCKTLNSYKELSDQVPYNSDHRDQKYDYHNDQTVDLIGGDDIF